MRLSIVIPMYNVENYISKTLYSLINQTEKLFEIILVDDGSTDNTCNVAESILIKSNHENYNIIRQKNSGVSVARNRGLVEATGEYVMFLDGDDYVSTELVNTIYDNIKKQISDIYCWGYNFVKEDQTVLLDYFDKYDSNLKKMTGAEALNNIIINKSMNICTGSAAFKVEYLIENNNYYTEDCINGEDMEFIYKALSKADEVIFIAAILFNYLLRNDSISNTYNINRFDAINAMLRTSRYMECTNAVELKLISEKITNEKIIEHYLYNFNSCFKNLYFNNKYSVREATKEIYHFIDIKFPNINNMIGIKMKQYRGGNINFLLSIKMFLISPVLYCWVIKIKSKYNM